MALFSADKKSLPVWLPWLLAAAGIVVAFWVVMALTADPNPDAARYDGTANSGRSPVDSSGDSPGYSDAATGEGGTTPNGPVAISGSAGLRSLGSMIGREVAMSDVPVNEVVGDIGFTVGRGANETLVTVDSDYTRGTAIEGGANVSLTGMVQAFPGDLPRDLSEQVDADNPAMIVASRVTAVE